MHASFIIHEGMYPVVFLVRPHKESVDKRLRKGIPASVPHLTVFENHRKSLLQHCERNELRLHFEWTKVN